MIGSYIRKSGLVPCQLGAPLTSWWGKSSGVVSRSFSAGLSSGQLVGATAGVPRVPVTMYWRNANRGGGLMRSGFYNDGRLGCTSCASSGGAWLMVSRKLSGQSDGMSGDRRKGAIVSRVAPGLGASPFLQSKLGSLLLHVRFKGGYSNFGHNPVGISKFTWYWGWFLLIAIASCWVDWWFVFEWLGIDKFVKDNFTIPPKVDAAEVSKHDSNDKVSVSKEDDSTEYVPAKKGPKLGFRDRKIIEYENRIRQYSTPDKTFRYFATLQVIHPSGDNEIFMTPDDFLRSITPGIKQPEGLGLDQFKRYDPKLAGRLELELDPDSIFYKLGSHGLISFSDYVFLLTVLSTSRRHFEIAFRMFDLNGDGDVDVEEFERVTALIRQRTSVGARHRELAASTNSLRETNSALNSYFFGPTRKEKLTIEKFLEFQQQLQTEILNLEFRRKGPNETGKISESDFSELLLAYAGYPAKRKARMLKRVKKKCKEEGYATGVSLDDYLKFFHLLSNIQDVDTALTFYHIAGAAIDPITLKHVARTVAHVELSDHIIDVVFTLFDENQDGQLSNREFVAVMKNRLMRGLEKPKDTGFFKLLTSIGRCAKESIPR